MRDARVLVTQQTSEPRPRQTWTGDDGRYRFDDLDAEQVHVQADLAGYVLIAVDGVASQSAVKAIPEDGCATADIELERGRVLEGWMTDAFGEPLQDQFLQLFPVEPNARPMVGGAVSDDRGYFRIVGLAPGEYELRVRQRVVSGVPGQTAPQFESRRIAIVAGQDPPELRLSPQSEGSSWTIAGRVEGLPESAGRWYLTVETMPDSGGRILWGTGAMISDDGRFNVAGLPTGDYLLRTLRSGSGSDLRLLASLHVAEDQRDLVLRPQPPTGVQGTIDFGKLDPGRLSLSFVPDEPIGRPDDAYVDPATGRFEHKAMLPGRYRAELRSETLYLVDPPRIEVGPGAMTTLELAVSDEFASLRGQVRVVDESGSARPAAHGSVGLRGVERQVQISRTDDRGRFVFPKVVPGAYEIVAWPTPNVMPFDESTWNAVAERVLEITIEAGFDMELDLKAAP
ncbi:MAG: hypothetical protein GC160_23370 [Acidobacteria bacterium]|nr:hypothetical protein [Acidobacteriota bacterium]